MTVTAAALVLAGCGTSGGNGTIKVEDAWVRLPAVPGRPAAAYLRIRTDLRPTTLIRVASPQAARAEMHESMAQGGMMSMTPLAKVPIPRDGTVTFQPGGRHVMLFGLAPAVKAGGTMQLRLTFGKDAPLVVVKAKIVGAADPAP